MNKFFFKLEGKTDNYYFEIGSNEVGSLVNIVLLILAGIALVLHFLNVNEKLTGTFLEIKRNEVGNVSGNNITINQKNK